MKSPTTPGTPAAEPTDTVASARRKFLQQSSGAAMAAPAVVLLLAAQSKSAQAGNSYHNGPKSLEPSKPAGKNLLDP